MGKNRLSIFTVFIVIAAVSFYVCSGNSKRTFDILITNGKIIDGSGSSWFEGDIGIRSDVIVEIGDLSGKTASQTIDAKGMVIAPGFIDLHTHSDRSLGIPGSNANLNYLTQGVTIAVVGNCGSGPYKIAETKAEWEKQGIGTNAIMLVGHGTLRRAVMGIKPAAPTTEELEGMASLLRIAMEEGAWGMSTGLEYVPGRYADTEEIIALAKVVGEFGGIYSSHMRNEAATIREAIAETITIAEEAGVRVDTSHLKICGKSHWGLMQDAVKLITEARERGIFYTADMYPYDKAASSPMLRYIGVPEEMEPLATLRRKAIDRDSPDSERKKSRNLYIDEMTKALSDSSKRAQIKEATVVGFPNRPSPIATWGWDSFTIMDAKKNTHLIGKIFTDLAEEQSRDPFDIFADLFIEERGEAILSDGAMSEEEMILAMKQDWLMFSSDGSAQVFNPENPVHPRNYGSFPRVVRKYVREDKILTLEEAIKKMTSLPASLLQIKDRGQLLKGFKADIVIFDPENVKDNATFLNSHQYSSGIEWVIINGKISIENSKYNNVLNGKVLLLSENK